MSNAPILRLHYIILMIICKYTFDRFLLYNPSKLGIWSKTGLLFLDKMGKS